MSELDRTHGEPYCSNCGYELTGATQSAHCPECGRPIVEVLMRPQLAFTGGRRFTSRARIFGMPIVDIAFGPTGAERFGKARGFIAIGDEARGMLAIGGRAYGLVSIGGFAMGGFSLGGLSIGLVSAMGGCAIGGTAIGGWAMGLLAQGGGAVGAIAQGGMAFGYYARAGGAFGVHTISPAGFSQEAADMFTAFSFFFGGAPINATAMIMSAILWLCLTLGIGAIICIMAVIANGRDQNANPA